MIGVKTDSNIEEMKQVIKNGGVKSMSRAMNDALSKGRTQLGKSIREVYAIKAATYNQSAKVVKSAPSNLKKGKIVIQSRFLSSNSFQFTPKAYKSQKGIKVAKRKRATLTIKKGEKKNFPHGFVANPSSIPGGTTLLWKREGEKISPVRSLSVAQMAEKEEANSPAYKVMEETYQDRLKHHLNRQFKVEE